MDTLLQLLRSTFSDQQTIQTTFVLLAAGAVAVLGLGVGLLATGAFDPLRRRLAHLHDQPDSHGVSAEKVAAALRPLAVYLTPRNEWKRSELRRQLVYAGYRSNSVATIFQGVRAILLLTCPVVVLLAGRWMPDVEASRLMFYAFVAAVVGSMIPGMVLDRLVAKRKRKLRVGFPDALDLLVVCVEAGLGLSPAIQRVADEMAVAHIERSAEFHLVNAEIRAGVDRSQALKNLADRTGLKDIRGLVALLIQTMKFGTSVADALRVYSEEFRDRRMQAAEEMAAKIGTKMIFPLIIFIFPAFFVVTVGPAIMRLIDVFGSLSTTTGG